MSDEDHEARKRLGFNPLHDELHDPDESRFAASSPLDLRAILIGILAKPTLIAATDVWLSIMHYRDGEKTRPALVVIGVN